MILNFAAGADHQNILKHATSDGDNSIGPRQYERQ